MTYQPFTENTAIAFVKKLQLISEDSVVSCKEIGDGNLNLVFHIQDTNSNHSLIVKQALPYAKVVGESWPLTLDRARIESEALQKAYDLVPKHVPKVYYSDTENAITIMEDLSSLAILRKGLISRKPYPHLAKHMGTYLAYTLFYTSDFGMDQQEKKVLSSQFINPELCKITEDLVFTDPYFDHETNEFPNALRPFIQENIWSDDKLKLEAAKLKYLFLTKGEALLHGDLHTGSIFADENDTKVIDPEFAFFGPMGFDIGAFLANIVLNYLSQEAHGGSQEEINEYRDSLLQIIQDTWNVFVEEFTALWNESKHETFMSVESFLHSQLQEILQDTIGFAGCKIIRRSIGLARVEDIESIANENVKIEVKKEALTLGKKLVLQRKEIETIEQLLEVITHVNNSSSRVVNG